MMKQKILALAITAAFVGAISGCNSDDDDNVTINPTPVVTGDTLILTSANQLVSVNRTDPSKLISQQNIRNLRTGDNLIGIDYRPADGKLYAVGSLGNIYTIDPSTSEATFKVGLSADSADTSAPYTGITGNADLMSVDFNPAADRLRVIGNNGQSLRINVDTGATTTDGNVAAPAVVTSAAYSNNYAGTANTKLFDIDVASNRIYLQNPPNDGTLSDFANLGVEANDSSGFDIDGINNKGYAVLNTEGVNRLYSIDLSTVKAVPTANAATFIGNLPTGLNNIRGLTLKPASDAGITVHGLTANNQLVSFRAVKPNEITATTAITGLASGESIVGIDYRLSTEVAGKSGVLYGLSNQGNLYIINKDTGAATSPVRLRADAADTTLPYVSLSGTTFAVDFNPVADRLRVISNTGQSLRINVDTGDTTTDGNINSTVNSTVAAAAYTNSITSTLKQTSTALFDLDSANNRLVIQNPPNDGTLSAVNNLGVTLGSTTGFDIAGPDNNVVLAAVSNGSFSTLYRINLASTTTATNAATLAVAVSGTANADASRIGGSSTPALIDLAIWLK